MASEVYQILGIPTLTEGVGWILTELIYQFPYAAKWRDTRSSSPLAIRGKVGEEKVS